MNQKKNGITVFFKLKGFYIVLVVCVIAAAVSSYLAVETLMDYFATENSPIHSNPIEGSDHIGTQVDNPQIDVPIEQPVVSEQASSSSVADQEQSTEEEVIAQEEEGSIPVEVPVESVQQTQVQPSDAVAEQPSFTMPVTGEIVKDFSADELVYNDTMNDWRTHNGIDIAAAIDTPVMAALGGEVVKIEIDDLWGGVVEIDTEGVIIRYAGLNPEIAVQNGQQLRSGEIIGRVGEVPAELADEPHIHIEAIKDGEYIAFTDLK